MVASYNDVVLEPLVGGTVVDAVDSLAAMDHNAAALG